MPWKNGLGVSAEIDRVVAFGGGSGGVTAGEYLWRLSQATVSNDTAFSQFVGFDRWLAVSEGEGLWLNEFRLGPLQPHKFSGKEAVDCRLIGGLVKDVGLIYDRALVTASMSVIEIADGIENTAFNFKVKVQGPDKAQKHLALYLYCLRGSFLADGICVETGDTLKIAWAKDSQPNLVFSGRARCLAISISLL